MKLPTQPILPAGIYFEAKWYSCIVPKSSGYLSIDMYKYFDSVIVLDKRELVISPEFS
jgi:hypothetical protein